MEYSTIPLQKPTILSYYPHVGSGMDYLSAANVIIGPTETFIGLEPSGNDTELLERCGNIATTRVTDLALAVVYMVISVLGISENLYVLYQMHSSCRLRINESRTSFFIFVGNLAVGDILILTLPIWITIHGLLNSRDILLEEAGNLFLVIVVFIHSCSARSSIIFVMFIALFRVASVFSPLRGGKIFTIRRVVVLSITSWILVLVSSVYSFDGTTRNVVYSPTAALTMVILKDKINESFSVAGQILAPFLVPGIVIFLALIYLATFLLKIYRTKMTKLRQNDSSYRPAREKDSLIMTVKLLLCFIITYTPWYVDGTLEFFKRPNIDSKSGIATTVHEELTHGSCFGGMFWHHLCLGGFLFAGSAANPLLYGQTLGHSSQKTQGNGLTQTILLSLRKKYKEVREDCHNEQINEVPENNIHLELLKTSKI